MGRTLIVLKISLSTLITSDLMDKGHVSEKIRTVSSFEHQHSKYNIQRKVQNVCFTLSDIRLGDEEQPKDERGKISQIRLLV